MQACVDYTMKAARDSTSVQVSRGSSSPLDSANDENVILSDYAHPQESDISAELCGSELHSPMSMNSSVSSEKFLSQSDCNRNHSDMSDDCPSPFQDKNIDPEHSNNKTSPKPTLTEISKCKKRKQSDEQSLEDAHHFENNSDVDEDSETAEQKHMADIVGEASSPGEFLNHALEFIKNGKDDTLPRNYWQHSSTDRKSQSPDRMDVNLSNTSKRTRVDRDNMNSMYQFSNLNSSSLYDVTRRDIKRERPRSRVENADYEETNQRKSNAAFQRRYQDIIASTLTSNEKLFVEAIKREVASAAEFAAEASAMRVLEMLEASGVYLGRSSYKQVDFHQNNDMARASSSSIQQHENRKRPLSTSSPIPTNQERNDHKKADPINTRRRNSETSGEREKIRTTSQSQLCFGSVEVNRDGITKSTLDGETIDLTTVGRGKVFLETPQKKRESDDKLRQPQKQDEQTQALSLVTNKSPKASVSSSAPTSIHQDVQKMVNMPQMMDSLHPFMGFPLVQGKVPFINPMADLPVPTSFPRSHLGYPFSKFLPDVVSGISKDRVRKSDDEHSSFPFSSSMNPLKSRQKTKPRVSPQTDDRRISPISELKRRRDIPTTAQFVEASNTSAFRPHDSMRSLAALHHDTSHLLRRSGGPDQKPLQHPPPFNLMYPLGFPLLPNFPSSPHIAAAALINQARRSGVADYGDLTNGSSSLPAERMPTVHPSLRSQMRDSGNYMGCSFGASPMNLRDSGNYDMEGSSYAFPSNMQEGLTPQHLKKAKLIFFYTRYPNANTLKTYFPDVKFTRAITSQLIKWFSNFREFFYIQMEKFARQAIQQGVVDPTVLRVSRDSEVFRVLNMHYNKCNEFYVPEKFLLATEASQREFFNAVRAGKDSDPAWKKVIYKVICKLDSDIPEVFKSPNVLDRLHEIRE
ncbi:uncharacterized protein LOC120327167 [Styela clava]